jgi:hypothetical protein
MCSLTMGMPLANVGQYLEWQNVQHAIMVHSHKQIKDNNLVVSFLAYSTFLNALCFIM